MKTSVEYNRAAFHGTPDIDTLNCSEVITLPKYSEEHHLL